MPPLRYHCVGWCWDRTQTVATSALPLRRSSHSLIPLVHFDLQISPQIFEKIWNEPNVISRGLGEDDKCKKPEVKNLGPNFLHNKEILPAKLILDSSVYTIHEDDSILYWNFLWFRLFSLERTSTWQTWWIAFWTQTWWLAPSCSLLEW